MYSLRKQRGLTMLEVLLVMVIGLFILGLSLQQYFSFRRDADVRQLQNNVDMIFAGLEGYFKSNCATSAFGKDANAVMPIQLSALFNQGYLVFRGGALPASRLVDTGASPDQQYILQYNLYLNAGVPSTRMQPMSSINGGATPADKPIGKIMIFKAQVAVKMRDSATVSQYVNLLNATCSSNMSGTTVTPCAQVPAGSVGAYVVFERGATTGGQVATSLSMNLSTVKQFTQMYSTYPILILLSGNNWSSQYFVCGS